MIRDDAGLSVHGESQQIKVSGDKRDYTVDNGMFACGLIVSAFSHKYKQKLCFSVQSKPHPLLRHLVSTVSQLRKEESSGFTLDTFILKFYVFPL